MADRIKRAGSRGAGLLAIGLIATPTLAQDNMVGKWVTTDFGRYDVPAEEIAGLCAEGFEQHYEDGTFVAFDLTGGSPVITLVGTCDYVGPDVTCTYQPDNFDDPIFEVYTDRLKRIDDDIVGLTALDEDGRPDPDLSWTYHRCAEG